MRLRSAATELRALLPRRLPWEPWSVLVPLVLVQWLGVAVVAHRAKHTGWLFAQGGAHTWYFTSAWILGGGHIPPAFVGHGWPLLLAPVTWFTGSSFVAALPVVLPLQVLVLLPLSAVGAYVLGARSGGRLIGYVSALIWTIAPFASLHYFATHPLWLNQILPVAVGLTELPYLPTMLALLVAGVLVLRALDERRLADAAGAGVAASFAIAIKPTSVLFLLAPVVAFAAARRPRELGVFAAAVVPGVLALLLWRERGLGHVGSLSRILALPDGTHFDQVTMRVNLSALQQYSWSPRVLEWIAVAGFVGLLKRSPVKALFFGTWLGSFFLAEGVTRATNSAVPAFWHVLLPAFPAFCALTASVPLLWPRADRRLAERFPYRPTRLVPVAAPALVFLLVPLATVAAAPPLHSRDRAVLIEQDNLFVPVDQRLQARARVENGAVTISWQPLRNQPAQIFYAVYRSPKRSQGLRCSTSGAMRCVLEMSRLAVTRETAYSDTQRRGVFTYRVAAMANYLNKTSLVVPIFIGKPVDVTVR